MKAKLRTPEVAAFIAAQMEEVERLTAWMQPGTPENAAYVLELRTSLRKYDEGPIY